MQPPKNPGQAEFYSFERHRILPRTLFNTLCLLKQNRKPRVFDARGFFLRKLKQHRTN